MKRKIFSVLFALVLVLSFGLVTAMPAMANGPTTITLTGDLLTTAPGAYQSAIQSYPLKWDITKGDLTIEGAIDFGGIQARGNTWDPNLTDGDDWFGIWSQIGLVKHPVFNSSDGVWMVTVEWTGGGDNLDTQIREILHMQEEPGTQPMPKLYTGPRTITGGDGDDTHTFKLQIHSTGATTGWAKLWIDDEQIKGDMSTVFEPEQMAYDGEDLSNAQVLVGIMSGNNPNNPSHTFSWSDLTVTGYPASYSEVWVDDDWAGTAPGTEVEPGKFFGFNAFATVQDGIDAVAGSTVNVAAGTYEESINVGKGNLSLKGAQYGVDPTAEGARTDETAESIIDGGGSTFFAVSITANGVTFDGFTVKNFGDTYGGDVTAHDVTGGQISNNIVTDTTTSGNRGYGIRMNTSTGVVVKKNYAHDCGWHGIYVGNDSTNITVQQNLSKRNMGSGICVWSVSSNAIEDNTCDNNTVAGIEVGASGSGIATGNTVEDNTITNQTDTRDDYGWGFVFHNYTSNAEAVKDNTFMSNTVTGNKIGVGFFGPGTNNKANFNNIYGNTEYGAYNDQTTGVDAALNWWGDASGPDGPTGFAEETYTGLLPGTGDAVSANVWSLPWLTRPFETVAEDAIAYFGISTYANKGWNIVSSPLALDQNVTVTVGATTYKANTWGGLLNLGKKATGDDYALKLHYTLAADNVTRVYTPIYHYDSNPESANFGWRQVTELTQVNPVDAYYIRMKESDSIPILFSPDFSVPSKELYKGWNLVGYAYMPAGGPGRGETVSTSLETALKTIERVSSASGDVMGYAQVVSPPMNQRPWVYIPPAVAGGEGTLIYDGPTEEGGAMVMGRGYWVFMQNPGTLAGLTFTPMSFTMQ